MTRQAVAAHGDVGTKETSGSTPTVAATTMRLMQFGGRGRFPLSATLGHSSMGTTSHYVLVEPGESSSSGWVDGPF